jgi:hypothetical protein
MTTAQRPLLFVLFFFVSASVFAARAAAADPRSAEVATWCSAACKEPERPAVMTRELRTEKTIGGRQITVATRTVETAEARRYAEDLAAWRELVGSVGSGSCTEACACAVSQSSKPLSQLTVADVARVIPVAPSLTWRTCICSVAPACAESGACVYRASRCAPTEPAHCEASRGCKDGRRCTLREDSCVATSVEVRAPTGLTGEVEGGAGPVKEMRKVVNLEEARAREVQMERDARDRAALFSARDVAIRLDKDPLVAPDAKVAAWKRLAGLRQVPPDDYASDAAAYAAAWERVAALAPGMDEDWKTISALLPLDLVSRAQKEEIITKFLWNYGLLGGRATFRTAQEALRSLRGKDKRAPAVPEALTPKGTGPLGCGPGEIPKRMELAVDPERMQEEDRLARLVARAKALDEDPVVAPLDKAAAWDAVAAMTMTRGNPAAEGAREAAASWRELAALTGRMVTDWRDQVLPAMALKSLTLEQKREVIDAFLDAYGKLSAEPVVAAATRLQRAAATGTRALDRELGQVEADIARAEAARRAEQARQEARRRAEAERELARKDAATYATAGWVTAGVGGAALVTAGVLSLLGQSTFDHLDGVCRADGACGPSQGSEVATLGAMRTGTFVALGVTGAATLTAVILGLVSASVDPGEPDTAGRVELGFGLGGLSLGGRF